MKTNEAKQAVKNALAIYAKSAGISFEQAVEFFKTSETTRECVGLLVLAQADQKGLRQMASTLSR